MSISFQLIYRFNTRPMRRSVGFLCFMKYTKLVLKFICQRKGPKLHRAVVWWKTQIENFFHRHPTLYCKAIGSKVYEL